MRTRKGRRSKPKAFAKGGVTTGQVMAGVGAVATLSAPAMAAEPVNTALDSVGGGEPSVEQTDVSTQMRTFAHDQLLKRTIRLARIEAHLRGKHLPRGFARHLREESTNKLLRRERALLHKISRLSKDGGGTVAAVDPNVKEALAAIAACESGGNPRAIGGGGLYRGAYQFDQHTWESVGGSGDPAAAPMAEQTRRAAILYSRTGASSWPVCGR
jgi:transglycosylase-like protein